MEKEIKKYVEMAKAYLEEKERKNYYEFRVFNDDGPIEYFGYQNALTDEEVDKIKKLHARYGDEYVNHLVEVFGDPDIVHDLGAGCEIVSIDLDTVYHQYTFTLSRVMGDAVSSRKIQIELSDDDYSKLLAWHLYDSHLVMNTLFYRDENLFKRIMRQAMFSFCDEWWPMVDDPFVVIMDEALADVDEIRKKHRLKKSSSYRALEF